MFLWYVNWNNLNNFDNKFTYMYVPEFCSKVQMMEDSDGNMHLKNLSLHPAANEEEGEEE